MSERDDRNVVVVANRSTLHDQPDDVSYWLTRPIVERIAAVEVMRRRVFGADLESRPRPGLRRVRRVSRSA